MLPLFVVTVWRLAALALELLLVLTHLKVLLCVGKPYSSAELSTKRYSYFLIDAASPWNSLAAILAGNAVHNAPTPTAATATLLPLLVLAAAGHGLLHLYYIAAWKRQHAVNVIKMSSVDAMSSRWQRFNASEVAWFLVGTSYDILTHAALVGLLGHTLLAQAAF